MFFMSLKKLVLCRYATDLIPNPRLNILGYRSYISLQLCQCALLKYETFEKTNDCVCIFYPGCQTHTDRHVYGYLCSCRGAYIDIEIYTWITVINILHSDMCGDETEWVDMCAVDNELVCLVP